ncbi:hypothetical protein G3I71_47570, partial [Streptomyces sp. SID12501]|nr:hypothetical protein [Streptomyces sp. SID12501]
SEIRNPNPTVTADTPGGSISSASKPRTKRPASRRVSAAAASPPITTAMAVAARAYSSEFPIASIGATEQDCRDRGLDPLVGEARYADIAYGWAMEDTTGFCKVLAERGTGRLLGAHLMGPQAATLIQPLVLAMTLGIDARTLAKSPYW